MAFISKFLCMPGIFFFVTRFCGTKLKQCAINAYYNSGKWDFLKNSAHPEMVKLVERYANGGHILDCGSGTGSMAAALSPTCYSFYHGVELSSVGVAYAKNRFLPKAEFFLR